MGSLRRGMMASVAGGGGGGVDAHLHWRIYIHEKNAPGGFYFAFLREVEMRATAGGTDLCVGGTATASSSQPGFGPEKAFDNDTTGIGNYWSTADSVPGPAWLAYEFTAPVEVREVAITSLTFQEAPADFELQYSDNGVDWTTKWRTASFAGWNNDTTLVFSENDGLSASGTWVRFDYSGADETFEVPAGVTSCDAIIIAASAGGGIYGDNQGDSGAGGYTKASFAVTPGETLRVRVGGGGKGAIRSPTPLGGLGGWPGGGSGSFGDTYGGGGGGYSGVFTNAGSPIAIAGAGGGGTGYSTNAGAGGGLIGGAGSSCTGGTQSAGGTGSYPGSAYQGGNANAGNRTVSTGADCGGGGGGYYGGAAPGGDGQSAAGGSGYIDGSATGATYAGVNRRRHYRVPPLVNGESTYGRAVGVTGVSTASAAASDGQDGVVWLRFS